MSYTSTPLKRSMSTSSDVSFLSLSSNSSSSSTYSRTAYDMLDRLAAVPAEATLHLWSAGNVRLPTGRDLTVPPQEALELIDVMAADVRFEVIAKVEYGQDADDGQISFRRTLSQPCTPASPMSDAE